LVVVVDDDVVVAVIVIVVVDVDVDDVDDVDVVVVVFVVDVVVVIGHGTSGNIVVVIGICAGTTNCGLVDIGYGTGIVVIGVDRTNAVTSTVCVH
jgi:hypothetical protein